MVIPNHRKRSAMCLTHSTKVVIVIRVQNNHTYVCDIHGCINEAQVLVPLRASVRVCVRRVAFWILLWLGYKASLFTMDDISFAMEKISLSFRQVLTIVVVSCSFLFFTYCHFYCCCCRGCCFFYSSNNIPKQLKFMAT